MLTYTTQLPFDVSVYLCEFVAINELTSSLHTTDCFHNSCNTSSCHVFPYQVHQINVKPQQFSPSHTHASARGLLRFSYSAAWANHNKNYDVMAETNRHVTHSARSTRQRLKSRLPDNGQNFLIFADTILRGRRSKIYNDRRRKTVQTNELSLLNTFSRLIGNSS